MSRERTCPAAHTAKGLALLRLCVARHFLGCRRSEPPGGHCNRRAKCRYGKSQLRQRILRATRMSRERTCPAALTAKGFALLRSVSLGIFSDVARANRPEVIVTAGQNAAIGKANYGREYSGQLGCRGSEPARQPTRLKGLPCYGLCRSAFSRMSRERTARRSL